MAGDDVGLPPLRASAIGLQMGKWTWSVYFKTTFDDEHPLLRPRAVLQQKCSNLQAW